MAALSAVHGGSRLAGYAKPKEMVTSVRSDGFRVGFSTGFSAGIPNLFRELGGAWNQSSRLWVFDRARVNGEFAAALSQYVPKGHAFDARAVARRVTEAVAHPDPDLFAPGLDVQVFPVIDGGGVVVLFRYDPLLARVLGALGGRFLRTRGAWHVNQPRSVVEAALAERAGVLRGHIYVHDSPIRLEEYAGASDSSRPSVAVHGASNPYGGTARTEEGSSSVLAVLSRPMRRLAVDEDLLRRAEADFGLYDYQGAGVRHLLSATSSLLADDMGLGKSRQAVVAARLVPGADPVLVVCPANLRINWQREINAVDPQATVGIVGQDEAWAQADWVVVSYERLGSVVQAMVEQGLSFRAVLYDEAHFLKDTESTRTRNAFLVSARVDRRFLLTATPILNSESDIHTLLRLSGHPIGDIPFAEFRKEFAGSADMRRRLSERLGEWMLRRRKNVLKTLKGKSLDVQHVELGVDQRERYKTILGDGDIPGLVKLGKLRIMLEGFKTSWLIDSVRSLAEDAKSIIFCEYLDSVDALAEEFEKAGIKAVTYTGRQSSSRKQRAVDSFMTEPEIKVFIAMRSAAGVGLNLTAANYVFFATLPWTAAALRQASDRAYRNGQLREVTVIMPVAVGTVDEDLLLLVRYKEALEQEVLGTEEFEGTGRPAEEEEQEKAFAERLFERKAA